MLWRVTRKVGIVQRPFLIRWIESGGVQHHIPLAQRNRHPLGEMQHHLAVRQGAAGFQETHMFGGDLRIAGKVELTEATPLAPFSDQFDRSKASDLS